MPIRQDSVGVGTIAGSSTFFPARPVEYSRRRGVATLAVIANGTSGCSTTNNCVTTAERLNLASGLTVTLGATGGLYTTVTINAAGVNYAEGDVILVPTAAGAPALRLIVSTVSALGAVTGIAIQTNTTSGASAAGPLATVPEDPRTGSIGLTVNATAAAGVITTLAVGNSAGRGYRIGDIVTVVGVTGATGPVTGRVVSVTG